MPLPDLKGWEKTRDALHWSSQVLGAIRVAGVAPQPNDMHYSLEPTEHGATTGPLKGGVALDLYYGEGKVRVRDGQRTVAELSLQHYSQASLMDALLEQLEARGKPLSPSRKKIVHEEPLALDRSVAAGYAEVQHRMASALRAFRARLDDPCTPVVLWPHHFDVAFLRFPTQGTNEKADPQIGTGFAPTSDGFPDPYLYAYAWPMPEGLLDAPLPAPARWVTEGFTGVAVDYADLVADLAAEDDPEAAVEDLLAAIHGVIVPRMKVA